MLWKKRKEKQFSKLTERFIEEDMRKENEKNPGTDRENENLIEGRNAVLEAFRSGKTIDKLLVLDGCQDGPVKSILREAKKQDTLIQFVSKERLTQISGTGKHQGVIAYMAAYAYAEVEDMLSSKIRKALGMAPRKGPKKGITLVTPTTTLTSGA